MQLKIKFELEKSMIDKKYQQQIVAVEKRGKPDNPLNKRLRAKIETEWNNAIEKKKQEYIGNGLVMWEFLANPFHIIL